MRRLGYQVEILDFLPRGVGGLVVTDHPDHEPIPIIRVAACSYRPHMEFGQAHEALEKNVPPWMPPDLKELYCDRGAAALMMPARSFLESGTACDWELQVLLGWWPHCSPYAILRRITDLVAGARVSAWTRSHMKSRVASQDLALPAHSPALEELVACEALHGSGRSEIALGGVRVRAWRNGQGKAVTLALRAV